MANEEVELHPAYRWDCPECGKQSYVDSVPAELTDDERKSLQEFMGVEPSDGEEFSVVGMLTTAPTDVTCSACGKVFPVELPGTPMPEGFNPHTDLGS
jgi:hypothetical protein